uniref:Uncharacterized protein n=1 Tax=Arundo donax TaxID=35708 RepID=A0A0A9EW67_ARUDO
MDRGRDGEEK